MKPSNEFQRKRKSWYLNTYVITKTGNCYKAVMFKTVTALGAVSRSIVTSLSVYAVIVLEIFTFRYPRLVKNAKLNSFWLFYKTTQNHTSGRHECGRDRLSGRLIEALFAAIY